MNDLAEVRSGWDRIKTWLDEQPSSDVIRLLRSQAADPLRKPHQVFVLCGSTAADDANQWRLYADGGSGYAIELDPSVALTAFSDLVSVEPAPERRFGIQVRDAVDVSPWLHVMYDDKEVVAALEQIVASVEAEAQSVEGAPEDAQDSLYDSLQSDAYEALATVAHLVKAPGFSGEHEVRVVMTFPWTQFNVKYRAGRYGIVGYAELTGAPGGRPALRVLRPEVGTPPKLSLPVRSVCRGPLLHDENEKTVRTFLDSVGLKAAALTTSDVPLR